MKSNPSQSSLIILISGKQGSGKSTLTLDLEEIARCAGHSFHRMKFADPLYAMHDAALKVAEQFGVLPADHPKKDGKLLQLLGTEWGRNTLGENVWVESARRRVSRLPIPWSQTRVIVFDDCRFENEFFAFPEAFRIRLNAEEATRRARADSWRDHTAHPSETSLDALAEADAFDLYLGTDPAPAASEPGSREFNRKKLVVALSEYLCLGREPELIQRLALFGR